MRYIFLASAMSGLVSAALVTPAQAGDTVLYGVESAWIDVADLPPATENQGSPLRLIETQTRLEDGVVTTYGDIAFALDSSEALGALNNITLDWMPDKGDLIVHRVELVRGGQVIDLIARGARFEVLRREEGLEQRILDGALTATLSVPGAQIGDVLRYSFTTTRNEQVLEKDMEHASFVIAEPTPIAAGRTILSWPVDSGVHWAATRVEDPIEDVTRDGYRFVTITLPVAEPDNIPDDAPSRFRLPPSIRATTFETYDQISEAIQPFFSTEGAIEPGGDLARKVADIAAQTNDPLQRAALATQFVQDEISYLLDGLDGGNYIPQSPAETWAARTGDCKAKSLLLLAMLRELGISAEAVLVHSRTGDAVPTLLPALGNFDHMIVRADIGGIPYWLDGTSSGLRASNMVEVPSFRYALPLRPGGTGLQEMTMRPQAIPDEIGTIRIDQSAGIDLPGIYDVTLVYSGISARNYQALALIEDNEQKENRINSVVRGVIGDNDVTDFDVAFDRDTGIATIHARGLVASPWDDAKGRFKLDVPYQKVDTFSFSVDRARPEIADLPVLVHGPIYYRRNIEWILPPEQSGNFRFLGRQDIDQVIGGTRLASTSRLEANRLTISEEVQSLEWEVPASALPEIRRETLRLKRSLPRLRAGSDVKRIWEYRGAERARLEPIAKMLDQLVEDADEDEIDALFTRFDFRYQNGDFSNALADISDVIERDASADYYMWRGLTHWELGDLEAALVDFAAGAQIDPDYMLYDSRLEALALLGRADEGVALVEEHAFLFEDPKDEAIKRSYILGFAGREEEGLDLLREELAFEPDDASLLNAMCWRAGTLDRVTTDTLSTCTRAVEEASNSASAIDSRALVYYRLGRYEEAVRDLDKALSNDPEQHISRYLRGIVKRAMGDEAGAREDIALALHAAPSTARLYSAWGLPPR
ncbi:tetratricopeptide repeat protein [Alteriqipengyuania sp.]|uniref:DUF3857 domain-containing protein n=1 Tax=Alteriqipengyuania sp. TaxID=2800692 RepID=UPI003511D9FC